MKLVFDHVLVRAGAFDLELHSEITGGVTGIFGPSGAGKSTLLETVAGLRRLSRGRIGLDGQWLVDAQAKRFLPPEKRHTGYLPQEGALFPHLSVARNLRYGQKAGRQEPGDNLFSLEHVCDVLGLNELLARSPSTLSGGERQRVALGRALVSAPKLLLLDEPLASLDPSRKEAVLPYLKRVRDEFGIPMLYVSHAAEEIYALCDDVVVLAAGVIKAQGSPAQLFEQTDEPRYRLKTAS